MYRKPLFAATPSKLRNPRDKIRTIGYTGSTTYATKFNPNSAKSRKLAEILPIMQNFSPNRVERESDDDEEPSRGSASRASVASSRTPRQTSQASQFSDQPRENFEQFSSRVMSAGGNHLDLDPELQAAFRDLSGGSNPLSLTTLSARPRGANRNRSNSNIVTDGLPGLPSSSVDSYELGTTRPGTGPGPEKVFETTFGEGTSEQDLAKYRERNRAWFLKHNVTQATRIKRNREQKEAQKKAVKEILKNFPLDNTEKVLRRGAKLLEESSKFKAKPEPPPEPTSKPENPKLKEILEYFPYSSESYIKEQRELMRGKLSIYERLEAKRDDALKQRFASSGFNSDEIDLGQGWRQAGFTRGRVDTASDIDAEIKDSEPFSGIKLSSLVGNRAAALQGYQGKVVDPTDLMNPLQKSMVEGLEEFELSAFLPKGHGHRTPRRGLTVQPLFKPDDEEPKKQLQFQSATARRPPASFRDPHFGLGNLPMPTGKSFRRSGAAMPSFGMGSTPLSILNTGNEAWKKSQFEMLLDNRSIFNKFPNRSSRGKKGEKTFVPSDWSVDDFDDKVLDGFNLKEKKKQDLLKETKLMRIRQIQMRENHARTYAFLTQQPDWSKS